MNINFNKSCYTDVDEILCVWSRYQLVQS